MSRPFFQKRRIFSTILAFETTHNAPKVANYERSVSQNSQFFSTIFAFSPFPTRRKSALYEQRLAGWVKTMVSQLNAAARILRPTAFQRRLLRGARRANLESHALQR
jgi:hypothetical protein